MIPMLYKQTYHGTGNEDRIGPLPAWIECEVTEERNGEFYLEGTLPVGSMNTEELAVDRIIMCAAAPYRSGYLPMQPFRIRKIQKGENVIAVTAHHAAYQLAENIITPRFSYSRANVQEILDWAFNQNGAGTSFVVPAIGGAFYFTSDIVLQSAIQPDHAEPMSVRAWIGGKDGLMSMITGKLSSDSEILPEPEIEWDGWTVRIKKQRGVIRDVSVAYAKNMEAMDYEANADGLITGYYGWWRGNTFTDAIIYSTNVSDWAYARIETVDMSNDFETEPTQLQLAAALSAYAAKRNANHLPTSITVTAIPDALQGVYLCDTVTVIHPGLQVKESAKIVQTVYDPIRERYNSITIGELRPEITDTIAKMLKDPRSLISFGG